MTHRTHSCRLAIFASGALLATAPSGQRSGEAPAGVSAADWAGIHAAYDAGRRAAFPADGGYRARNPGQRWRTHFDGRGFTIEPDSGGWTWGLELERYGLAGRTRTVGRPEAVRAEGERVEYRWDGALTEWYENEGRGLEHGYTLEHRPSGAGGSPSAPLSLTLAVRGDLSPRVDADGRGVRFVDEEGASVLTYSGLAVFDAGDRSLPARLERADDGLRLTVDDRGARYPLTIDPLAQQAYLKASNTGVNDNFGISVAVSGSTVVVGATGESSSATGVNGDQSNDLANNSGAAYVFVRGGSGWSQQAYLKASNTNANDSFGSSVSISGDTIAVCAWGESSNATGINGNQANNSASESGAVYVFVRSGTTWSQEAYIKASNTNFGDQFGLPLSLSGDTLLVGSVGESSSATGVNGLETDNTAVSAGAAYVFTRSGTTWSQQAYLKASNTAMVDNFGASVALAGDTAVVGAIGEDSDADGVNGDQTDNSASSSGAVYVFVRSGTSWSQQAYLKASNSDTLDWFGRAVSVSGDTIVVGAREGSNATGVNGDEADNSAGNAGAAYVFVRSGTNWSQEAYLKASNTDAGDHFGNAVSVSGDRILIGAFREDSNATGLNGDESDDSAGNAGAAYLFERSGTTWSQSAYLKASNAEAADSFGTSVAASGSTLVVGAESEDGSATGVNGAQTNGTNGAGAAYVFFSRTRTRQKTQVYRGPIPSGGTRDIDTASLAITGDSPSLRITHGHGGAVAVLWIGTTLDRVGDGWLVAPALAKRMLVLGADGSLEVPLKLQRRAFNGASLYAQAVVLGPDGRAVATPVVGLSDLSD